MAWKYRGCSGELRLSYTTKQDGSFAEKDVVIPFNSLNSLRKGFVSFWKEKKPLTYRIERFHSTKSYSDNHPNPRGSMYQIQDHDVCDSREGYVINPDLLGGLYLILSQIVFDEKL